MASQRETRLTGDEPILYRSILIQAINQDEYGLVAARQHDVTTITDGCRAVVERALVLVRVAQSWPPTGGPAAASIPNPA
jgi:hypothetical protein